MTHARPAPTFARTPRTLGFSWPVLVLLAVLAAPRVVLHDLDVVSEGSFANALLVFVPPLVWVAAIVLARVPRPFVTGVVIGALYAVMLAVGHQLLWEVAWGADELRLGGNLRDLPPAVGETIVRTFAFASSLVTGTLVGVVTGAIAWLVTRALRPSRR